MNRGGLYDLSKILNSDADDAAGLTALTRLKEAFEIHPIILVDGIADTKLLYMQDLFEAQQQNSHFAVFTIESGASYFDISTSDFPFYDAVAASNNSFENERLISFRMQIRKTEAGDVATAQTKLSLFWYKIEQHRQKGGSYILVTQAGVIADCVLLSVVLLTDEDSSDYASTFLLSFKHILLSTERAEVVYNTSMSKRFKKEPDLAHIENSDRSEHLFTGIH